jgi:hypothetical protein
VFYSQYGMVLHYQQQRRHWETTCNIIYQSLLYRNKINLQTKMNFSGASVGVRKNKTTII